MSKPGSPVSLSLAASSWAIFSALHLLFGALILLGLCTTHLNSARATFVALSWALAATLVLGGALGIAAGISVPRRRPWARSVIVFWSAAMIVICSMLLVICVSAWKDTFTRSSSTRLFHQILPGIAGIYFALGVSWFVKLTRRSVLEQFGTPDQQERSWSNRWRSIYPLGLLAGFYILDGVLCFQIALIQSRTPVMFFGFPLFASVLKLYLSFCGLSYLVMGITILRRKPWGVDATIALTILLAIGNLVTLFDTHSAMRMRDALAIMAARGTPRPLHDPVSLLSFREQMSLGVASLSLFILSFWRKRFLGAVANTGSCSTPPPKI